MYLVFLFFKYKQRKTGSYNVYVKQHSPRSRLQSVAECGTSSAHSSFRDITEQCQRGRLLSGVAVLSSAGSGEDAGSSLINNRADDCRWSRNSEASMAAGVTTGLITMPRVQPGIRYGPRQTL